MATGKRIAGRGTAGSGRGLPALINLIHDVDALRFMAGEIAGMGSYTAAGRGFRV